MTLQLLRHFASAILLGYIATWSQAAVAQSVPSSTLEPLTSSYCSETLLGAWDNKTCTITGDSVPYNTQFQIPKDVVLVINKDALLLFDFNNSKVINYGTIVNKGRYTQRYGDFNNYGILHNIDQFRIELDARFQNYSKIENYGRLALFTNKTHTNSSLITSYDGAELILAAPYTDRINFLNSGTIFSYGALEYSGWLQNKTKLINYCGSVIPENASIITGNSIGEQTNCPWRG